MSPRKKAKKKEIVQATLGELVKKPSKKATSKKKTVKKKVVTKKKPVTKKKKATRKKR